MKLLDGEHSRPAVAPRDELPRQLAGRSHSLVPEPCRVCDVPAFGKEHVVAERMPPENAYSDLGQDGLVDQLSDLAVGLCRRAHQGLEIEQERLIEDADERGLVGELLGGRHADVDAAGRHGINDLIVGEQLRLVEDLDSDVVLGLLFDLLLEARQAPAEDRIGDRELQVGLQLDLLSGRTTGRKQERYEQRAKQPYLHSNPPKNYPRELTSRD